MAKIHPTAIVAPDAKLADSVEVGPYCVIEEDVEIGAGTRLLGQCRIGAHTVMGEENIVYPFAAIGTDPEDYSYDPAQVSYTRIGSRNRFREGVTVNRGTMPGSTTTIGDGCFLMANAHVAHNCQVGNKVIMVTQCGIAGHCQIGDNCLISGLSGVHQFCRIGRMAVLSGGSAISMDLAPFMIGDGRNGGVRGFNIVGMRRNGFPPDFLPPRPQHDERHRKSQGRSSPAARGRRIPRIRPDFQTRDPERRPRLTARLTGKDIRAGSSSTESRLTDAFPLSVLLLHHPDR